MFFKGDSQRGGFSRLHTQRGKRVNYKGAVSAGAFHSKSRWMDYITEPTSDIPLIYTFILFTSYRHSQLKISLFTGT